MKVQPLRRDANEHRDDPEKEGHAWASLYGQIRQRVPSAFGGSRKPTLQLLVIARIVASSTALRAERYRTFISRWSAASSFFNTRHSHPAPTRIVEPRIVPELMVAFISLTHQGVVRSLLSLPSPCHLRLSHVTLHGQSVRHRDRHQMHQEQRGRQETTPRS